MQLGLHLVESCPGELRKIVGTNRKEIATRGLHGFQYRPPICQYTFSPPK